MVDDYRILCGEATESRPRGAHAAVHRLRLGHGESRINLDFTSLSEPLVARLPSVAADLAEIAAYVFTADQLCRRGGESEFEYGQRWRRRFVFDIPVREPSHWCSSAVNNALCAALNFMSDDDFEFNFRKADRPTPLPDYLFSRASTMDPSDIDEVMLFSGGLDSFAGAVQEILIGRRKVALVSHVSTEKTGKPQRELVKAILAAAPPGTPAPLHVQVNLNKEKALGRDNTQRTRAMVFAAFAGIVAMSLGRNRIRVFENGVISINLATSLQIVGARASRTTHPKTLHLLSDLLTLALGQKMTLENPLLWKTKTDILKDIKSAGYARLCAQTISCAHTIARTIQHPHCGRCSQCIDRRLAAIAAGYTEEEDPPESYAVKFDSRLVDNRDVTQFERYVGTALRFARLPTDPALLQGHGEIARVLRYAAESPEKSMKEAVKLHKRHGEQVVAAVMSMIGAHTSELIAETVDGESQLAIALGLLHPKRPAVTHTNSDEAPNASTFAEGVTMQVERDRFRISQSGVSVQLGNTNVFRLAECLAEKQNTFVSYATIRSRVWSEQKVTDGAIHRVASQLRGKLKQLPGVSLDGSQEGHYCLQVSANRQPCVSVV